MTISNKTLIAFDVDETLEISNGPISIESIRTLYNEGYIVGVCGNWKKFVAEVKDWNKYVSFIGQFYGIQSKSHFLSNLKNSIPATRFIMVGNDPAHYGNSNDIEAANEAGYEFIREDLFKLEDFIKREIT